MKRRHLLAGLASVATLGAAGAVATGRGPAALGGDAVEPVTLETIDAANAETGDEVQFVSVTTEAVGRSVTEGDIADWWREHDGNWLVAADPTVELFSRVGASSFPTAVTIDATGRVRWLASGVHTTTTLTERIEAVTP